MPDAGSVEISQARSFDGKGETKRGFVPRNIGRIASAWRETSGRAGAIDYDLPVSLRPCSNTEKDRGALGIMKR
jgi:hypothetical protein